MLTRQKSIKTRDEYRKEEELKAREEIRRIKDKHSPTSSRNRPGSPHKSLRGLNKHGTLTISNQIEDDEIYMTKFNQEVAD